MSTLNEDKELKPARKAWKRLKNNLQSKLKNQPKILNSIKSFSHRLSLTKRPPSPPPPHLLRLTNNTTIYVDELYPGFAEPRKAAESMDEVSQRLVNNPGPESGLETYNSDPPQDSRCIDERAEEFINQFRQGMKLEMDPQDSRCINERAEEFRSKFTQDMKLAGEADSKGLSPTEYWENNWDPHDSRCIDERAEEFIAKFRRDMKLERESERSIEEYEKTLKSCS